MELVAALAVGFAAGVAGGLLGEWLSRRLGLLGTDAMKPWRRERVPDAGGAGLALLLALVYLVLWLVEGASVYLAAGLLALYILTVGLADDMWRMDPVTKPLLTMSGASILLLVPGVVEPRVFVPLYGWASLKLVYPMLLPLLIGVSSNAFNMIDVVNGSMPSAALAVLASLLAATLIAHSAGVYTPSRYELIYTIILMAALSSYLALYNRYPARVFNGDSGSLTIGALVGLAAIILKQEAVYLVAMSPLILNGFQIVSTVRGFAERREIPRPTRVDENGYIHASCNPRSPPTLVQLIVLRAPLREDQVCVALTLIYLVSMAAGVAAALVF